MKFHKQKMLQNVVVSYSMNIAGNKPGHWERHLLLATAAPSCGDFFHFTPCPCLKEILPAQWLMLSTVASLLYKKNKSLLVAHCATSPVQQLVNSKHTSWPIQERNKIQLLLHNRWQPQTTHGDTFWRKTFYLQTVWLFLHNNWWPQEAHANPFRRHAF